MIFLSIVFDLPLGFPGGFLRFWELLFLYLIFWGEMPFGRGKQERKNHRLLDRPLNNFLSLFFFILFVLPMISLECPEDCGDKLGCSRLLASIILSLVDN